MHSRTRTTRRGRVFLMCLLALAVAGLALGSVASAAHKKKASLKITVTPSSPRLHQTFTVTWSGYSGKFKYLSGALELTPSPCSRQPDRGGTPILSTASSLKKNHKFSFSTSFVEGTPTTDYFCGYLLTRNTALKRKNGKYVKKHGKYVFGKVLFKHTKVTIS